MENLSKRLVDKSIEAFIMGLEIYNKPTIRYRIEGFSFFICNAWELMLKAELLNKNIPIYYPNSDRTISLEKTIQKIYTDKKQPLRINLEKIIELRNTSTHFITEEYETIYAPFFQSCVLNFLEQIKRFHNVDVTRYVSQNFLTLTVNLNILSNEEIRGKYSQEMAERLISNKNELEFLENNNSSNDLYIPIRHEFVQIKDKSKADFTYAIDSTSDVTAKIITKLQDPKDKYKLSIKNVINSINKQIKTKSITFNYRTASGDASFNEYT
ncbi:DUF3644 domain-containing protein [Limosilactobacillus fermentum]|nr:DUF3644 domain-containing protein [Limosilactobacillus fermentum]ARB00478.1 hypothetical protein B5C32_03495 [Limosilactobacillus fermentum]MCH5387852.1 DUF3644 domain-containing protein [Limosilactobacillus fermentum]QSE66425.1 DUF3644 domain-containing protein [Limosilactobacillus fermentum]QSH34557.1 DUF3644 domain-containing protein [Limosilactobacillus fermentum]QSH36600.1 DUF3644 domain-containing protein [Limosilactobacillus fermentum]